MLANARATLDADALMLFKLRIVSLKPSLIFYLVSFLASTNDLFYQFMQAYMKVFANLLWLQHLKQSLEKIL